MEKVLVNITLVNGAKLIHTANFGTYVVYKCEDEKGKFIIRIDKEHNKTTIITFRLEEDRLPEPPNNHFNYSQNN